MNKPKHIPISIATVLILYEYRKKHRRKYDLDSVARRELGMDDNTYTISKRR